MNDYTIRTVQESTAEVQIATKAVGTITKVVSTSLDRRANIQGTRLVKLKKFATIQKEVHGTLDATLWEYVLHKVNGYNVVNFSKATSKSLPKHLADAFQISLRKAQTFVAKLYKADFAVKVQNTIIVNPFAITPYTTKLGAVGNDQLTHQMQEWWDGDRKELPNIVTVHETEILRLLDESSKEVF